MFEIYADPVVRAYLFFRRVSGPWPTFPEKIHAVLHKYTDYQNWLSEETNCLAFLRQKILLFREIGLSQTVSQFGMLEMDGQKGGQQGDKHCAYDSDTLINKEGG